MWGYPVKDFELGAASEASKGNVLFITNDEPRRVHGFAWPENSSIRVNRV
jgi:hypothetical protein